jgi:DNA repair exonuclease SbcCD nuclease subunit
LRFLITGDIHCHNFKQFSYTRKSGMNSRLYKSLKVFDILLLEAKRRSITKIILNGDIFEDNDYLSNEVYSEVYRKLETLFQEKIEVVINVGNHDISTFNDNRTIHTLLPFRQVAKVVEKSTVWKGIGIVPWMPSKHSFQEAIGKIPQGVRTLITHIGVKGALVGPRLKAVDSKISLDDLEYERFKLVLLSDFHKPQQLAKGVFYLGSPLQKNFGEDHDPCIWDISLLNEPPWYRRTAIQTNLPKFISTQFTTIDGLRNENFRGNYLRITVPGSFIRDHAIENVAKEVGFQYQIVQETEKHKAVKIPKIVDIEGAIIKYARTKRLAQIGIELFQ